MKTAAVLMMTLFASIVLCEDYKFRADFPPLNETSALTADAFKNSDAVIILKGQYYTEGPHSRFDGFTVYLSNEMTITSKVIMAKVFTNAGVEAFGSFEYEYDHRDNYEERRTFNVHARIQKPDGSVRVMPDSAVHTIAGSQTGSGKTLTKKTLFKLADLAPGDIVQVEYVYAVPYSYMRKVLFFYHDRYPVLHSSVIVNMDKRVKVKYLSFPSDIIGAPDVQETISAYSYMWSATNLAAIPKEPYCRPFADVSYITTIVDKTDDPDNGWRELSKQYVKYNIKKGSISKSFMRTIGLDPELRNPSWDDVDRVYTALRKYFTLKKENGVRPDVEGIDDLIDEKEADASDIAYIMLKILERWEVKTTPLLIRDKRDGVYEPSVASYVWFDRLAISVALQGAEKVYDFDRSIPSRYEFPWFLNGITAVALHDTGVSHIPIAARSSLREHTTNEFHWVTIKSMKNVSDSVIFQFRGAKAQKMRSRLYSVRGKDLQDKEHELLEMNALRDVEFSSINNYLDEPLISISGKGPSQGSVAAVDSFLAFHPRNHVIREFRDVFSAGFRYDDILLDEPFALSLQWVLFAPPGYVLATSPSPVSVESPFNAASQTTFIPMNDTVCVVKTDLIFGSASIPKEKYKEFTGFLDKTIASAEREVVFKKK